MDGGGVENSSLFSKRMRNGSFSVPSDVDDDDAAVFALLVPGFDFAVPGFDLPPLLLEEAAVPTRLAQPSSVSSSSSIGGGGGGGGVGCGKETVPNLGGMRDRTGAGPSGCI